MAYLRDSSGGSSAPAQLALARLGKSPGVRLGLSGLPPIRLGSGVEAVDALLQGGIARGRINEITGSLSSGRTSLAWRFLAAATHAGELAAVVDCGENFDAFFAGAIGVELSRLLLVLPPSVRCGVRCAEEILTGGGFALVVLDMGSAPMRGIDPGAWLRLAKRAEQSGSALLLLSSRSMAGPFVFASLDLRRLVAYWSSLVPGKKPCFASLLAGLAVEVRVARSKFGPPGGKTVVHFTLGERSLTAGILVDGNGGGEGQAGEGRCRAGQSG